MKIYPPASASQLLQLHGFLTASIAGHLAKENLTSDNVDDWFSPNALDREVRLLMARLREGLIPLYSVKAVSADVFIDPRLSIKEWVKVRKSAAYDPNITPWNVEKVEKFLTVKKDAVMPYRARLVAFRPSCPISMSMVLRLRGRLGLAPIGFEHECALSEQRPELVKELMAIVNPDVTIMWQQDNDGSSYHSELVGSPDVRVILDSGEDKGKYSEDTWFLGLAE